MAELNKISNQQLIEEFGIIGDYYIDMTLVDNLTLREIPHL